MLRRSPCQRGKVSEGSAEERDRLRLMRRGDLSARKGMLFMELEYLFLPSGAFTAFQFVFMSSLLVPGILGRPDMYRSAVNRLATLVVTFGPMALLVYILYEVSLLS